MAAFARLHLKIRLSGVLAESDHRTFAVVMGDRMNSATCKPRFPFVELFTLLFHMLPAWSGYSSPIEQGRIYTDWFYGQEFDRLYVQLG